MKRRSRNDEPGKLDLGEAAELRGFAFDLDGTIWEGPRLLPGAVGAGRGPAGVAGSPVVFASNSRGMPRACSATGSPSWVSPRRRTRCSRRSTWPARRSGGGWGRCASCRSAPTSWPRSCGPSGHAIVADEDWETAQAVVVGIDPHFSYDRLRAASRAVAAGAAFFAVNMDRRFPVGPGEFDPGCGALAEAIAVAGGVAADRHRQAGAAAVPARPSSGSAAQPHQAAMVGDSIASDIEGGRAAGMFTVWLNPEHHGPPPGCVDLHVRDLDELHRLWRRSRA